MSGIQEALTMAQNAINRLMQQQQTSPASGQPIQANSSSSILSLRSLPNQEERSGRSRSVENVNNPVRPFTPLAQQRRRAQTESIPEALRQCFPTLLQRTTSRSLSTSSTQRKRKSSSSSKREKEEKTVLKQLTIVPNPTIKKVPKYKFRETLEECGFIKTFGFKKSYSAEELMNRIKSEFPCLDGYGFEFVKACNGKLTVPNLSEGLEFDSNTVLCFAGQGGVYVRTKKVVPGFAGDYSASDDDDGPLDDIAALNILPFGSNIEDQNMFPAIHVLEQPAVAMQNEVETNHLLEINAGQQEAPISLPAESNQIYAVSVSSNQQEASVAGTSHINEVLVNQEEPNSSDQQATTNHLNEDVDDIDNISIASTIPMTGDEEVSEEKVDLEHLLSYSRGTKEILVHRSQLRKDLMNVFDDQIFNSRILVRVIDFKGQLEKGQGIGVLRDVFTSFFEEFNTSCGVGADEIVPIIRHDMLKNDWQAVARIIGYGISCGYFPLKLSYSFIASCMFGEEAVSEEDLLSSFKLYISADERLVVEAALSIFDENDSDLLDFLSSYNCYSLPTEENIKKILLQLAHKELIQKPKYISTCFQDVFSKLKFPENLGSVEKMKRFYVDKSPTVKKVLALFETTGRETADQRQSFDFLKKYIKSLDRKDLSLFLRFLTGSDILVANKITISYVLLDGLERRPVARTCGPVLELPQTYKFFNEMKEEFTMILSNRQCWEFNII